MNSYDRGDTTRLSFEPKDADEAPVNPSTVRVLIRKPYSPTTIHTWPAGDGAIVHPATGTFTCDVLLDKPGVWRVRWESTGNPQLSEGELIFVRSDAFVGA